jgi:hypothetical protein
MSDAELPPRPDEPRAINWILCENVEEVDFAGPDLAKIKGWTVDADTILTDGLADSSVRPEGLDMLNRIQAAGKAVMLLTRSPHRDFAVAVLQQVNRGRGERINCFYRGDETGGLHPDTHRSYMHSEAGNYLNVHGRNMGHVSARFRSHWGSMITGYEMHIWPLHADSDQPRSARAKLWRGLETNVVRSLFKVYPYSRTVGSE